MNKRTKDLGLWVSIFLTGFMTSSIVAWINHPEINDNIVFPVVILVFALVIDIVGIYEHLTRQKSEEQAITD